MKTFKRFTNQVNNFLRTLIKMIDDKDVILSAELKKFWDFFMANLAEEKGLKVKIL